MSQRRNFTPQFKARVVLELLTKLRTTAQVCREYDLKEQVVTRWKAEFLEPAPSLFATTQQRDADHARIAELERLVGRLALELEIAKKDPCPFGHHRVMKMPILDLDHGSPERSRDLVP